MIEILLLQFLQSSPDPGGHWAEVHRVIGTHPQARLGWSVALIGDLNQDGCAEYALGAHQQKNQGQILAGSVYVIDGATGQALREHPSSDLGSLFGWSVCRVGDVNHDGIPDYGATAHGADPGQIGVRVFDGFSGATLHQIAVPANSRAYGNAMDGIGDWNGDGCADFAVADYFVDLSFGRINAGIIYIHSGSDGALLQSLEGYSIGHQFGKGLRGQGDVDGDGIQDLAVWSAWRRNSVHILKGGLGAEIHLLDSPTGNGAFGAGLDFFDDLDGDHCDEILVGAPTAGAFEQGEVYLYSGQTGSLIYRWQGEHQSRTEYGEAVACLGDMDGDGVSDIAIGSPVDDPQTGAGKVYFHSGADGRLTHTISTLAAGTRLGNEIAGGMDVSGDGKPDVVLPNDSMEIGGIHQVGAVLVFSFDPFLDASDRQLSASAGGTIQFAADFPASEAGFQYRLLASTNVLGNQGLGTKPWMTLSGVTIPLVETALTHRMLNRPPAVFAGAQGSLDASGDATITLTLPPGAAASEIGRTLRFATVSFAPGGQASLSSAAVLLTILP